MSAMPKEHTRKYALGGAFLLALGIGAGSWLVHSPSSAEPPPAPAAAEPSAPVTGEEESAPNLQAANVQVVFSTVPSAKASVTWGKKTLGRIEPGKPLVVTRPRDSGPMDVIIRAAGFMAVHTRAHTFSDHKMQIRLTRPEQSSTLLGYRVPLDAGPSEDSSDAGVDFNP
ncbi:MAG: hypothetical protein RL385_6101 [Pseudomonadota bacterium]|jgi:hypothetical protein